MTPLAVHFDSAVRNNAGVWFDKYARIWPKDRSGGMITPVQNYLQQKIQATIRKFEELNLPIRIIGLKPRQKGSTTYFAAVDYHFMRRKPMYACVIGGQYSQTNELWDMISTYNKNDTFNWGNSGQITDTFGQWDNGSQLKAETANDQLAGIAGTYQILHATEVARWSKYGVKKADIVLANILKCVPLLPNTVVVKESTAEGASGHFYESFVSAVDAEKFIAGEATVKPGDYVRIFAPWFEFEDSAIRLTPEQKKDVEKSLDADPEYEGEKDLIADYGTICSDGLRRLGTSVVDHDLWEQLAWRRMSIKEDCERDKNIFDRDYPHSWEVAFQKSGQQRFNKTGMAFLKRNISLRARLPGVIEEAGDRMVFRQTDENEAKVIVYEKPVNGRRYLLAVDPMTGATQANGEDPDLHGAFVLREGYFDRFGTWNKPAAVARVVPCRWDIDVLEEAVWRLAKFYGPVSGCKIAIEMNMDRGITELLKQRGADLYMREVFNKTEQKTLKAYGYMTDPRTRERVIECLAKAIREYDKPGMGIDIWDDHAITQLMNFVRKKHGRSEAEEGHHDDDVMALGIGLLLIEHATTYFAQHGSAGLPPDLQGLISTPTGTPGAFS